MILVNGCYLCKRDADHMLLWCPFAYLKKKKLWCPFAYKGISGAKKHVSLISSLLFGVA